MFFHDPTQRGFYTRPVSENMNTTMDSVRNVFADCYGENEDESLESSNYSCYRLIRRFFSCLPRLEVRSIDNPINEQQVRNNL